MFYEMASSPLSSAPPSPEKPAISAVSTARRPRRTAATVAAASIKGQVASSPSQASDGEEDDTEEDEESVSDQDDLFVVQKRPRTTYSKAAGRPRRAAPRRQAGLSRSISNPSPSTSMPKASPLRATRSAREGSSLTPMSTPSTLGALTPSPVKKTPSKRRGSLSLDSSPLSTPTKRARLSSQTLATSSKPVSRTFSSPLKYKDIKEVWKQSKLDGSVFVRLDQAGKPVHGGSGGQGAYWWMAQLLSRNSDSILKLKLFGDDGTNAPGREILLFSPCEDNILPFMNPFTLKPRFTLETSYLAHTPTPEELERQSRGSKQNNKTWKEREARWKFALSKAMALYDEELPDVDQVFLVSQPSQSSTIVPDDIDDIPTEKKARKPPSAKVIEDEPAWDAGPDLSLNLPDPTHVLAFWRNEYWPAKVLSYLPPNLTNKKGKVHGKYDIVFLDGMNRKLKRDEFCEENEDGFVTCKVGDFTNQADDDDVDDSVFRAPSPDPIPSPPVSKTDFLDLSIREQLRYVRSSLEWTLHSRYPPTQQRCEDWYKGGRQRQSLMQGVGASMGPFEAPERAEIREEVRIWALRNERTARREDDDDADTAKSLADTASQAATEVPPASLATESETLRGTTGSPEVLMDKALPPADSKDCDKSEAGMDLDRAVVETELRPVQITRPTGCPAYEALTASERVQFCSDIVVPEAVVQLLAWREGLRFEIAPLPSVLEADSVSEESMEREKKLHQAASALTKRAPPNAWVDKLMSLRNSRAQAIALKTGSMLNTETELTIKRIAGSSRRPNAGRRIM